jgi:Protein of unknown function (DUF1549)/Protein of unknown function (DUF1553)
VSFRISYLVQPQPACPLLEPTLFPSPPVLICCLLVAILYPHNALAEEPAVATVSSSIEIYPRQITVSNQYPARFIAIETMADGSAVDRTRDVAALMTKQHPALLIGSNGTLERDPNAPLDGSLVEVEANLDGRRTLLKANILQSSDPSPVFAREVSAILGKAGCNLGTCHGNLHGKGGFRLSLRGDDAELDYRSIVRDSAGRRVDPFAAARSLMLTKPSGQLAHQGGTRFELGSTEYAILKRWIEEGCRWNSEFGLPSSAGTRAQPAETLTTLNVYPPQAMLAPDCRSQQVVVTATFADGATRDVTRWARYEPSLPTDVNVTADGLVTATKPLDVSISVSYLSGRAATRLTFLPELPASKAPEEMAAPQRLDQLVENQLSRMRLQAREAAAENVLLRRIYLVVIGRLPTSAEARDFLTSTAPDKRERLTESLINQPGYAALWAMRWSDLLRNEQKVMSPEGARGWHAWMIEQVAADRPLTEFVGEMITTVGSTYEHPPASFHRTHRDPETAAESIGQVFLGVRLQCARCHNHPFDRWRQDDYYGLAAYFATVERKQVDNAPKDKFDKHVISGDEIISFADKPAMILHPGRAASVPPKPMTETYAIDVDGQAIDPKKLEGTPMEALAGWLTRGNRQFARNMANRIFFHLMGRGIVDPPDDFRDSNPPSNPELLEYLTDELIRSNYSVRALTKLILSSRMFARAAVDDVHIQGLDAEANFAGYPMRRMSAEVLMDALSDVTQVISKVEEQAAATTASQRAVARAEVPPASGFLATFGKPNRLLVCECERSNAVSLGQSLMLINGSDMRDKLAESRNCISAMLDSKTSLPQTIDDLYMATLTRTPTPTESACMVDYVTQSSNARAALEDVLWALINSQEFAVIR